MRADYPTPEAPDELRSLWKAAFGDSDAFLDGFFETAFAFDRCRCISMDGQIAAALYWMDCRCRDLPYAYIYAVATQPALQGQGLCRALMADTHGHLRSLGYAGCILVPGSRSLFAMYEKMGYRCFSGMDRLQAVAGKPATIREITAEEYGTLRKEYLPEDGVVQEGLDFLATYAKMYAGDDFICAVDPKSEPLSCIEFLGNAGAAAGILGALGKKSGSFRIPGNEPFAMYYPLADIREPGYFGLAFD